MRRRNGPRNFGSAQPASEDPRVLAVGLRLAFSDRGLHARVGYGQRLAQRGEQESNTQSNSPSPNHACPTWLTALRTLST